MPLLIPHWSKPVVIDRHGPGDQYKAGEIMVHGPGAVKLSFTPDDGGPVIGQAVSKAPGPGVTRAIYNLDESIVGFARACFNYGRLRHYPVYPSTKHTIMKIYDGRFKNLFDEVSQVEFAERFNAADGHRSGFSAAWQGRDATPPIPRSPGIAGYPGGSDDVAILHSPVPARVAGPGRVYPDCARAGNRVVTAVGGPGSIPVAIVEPFDGTGCHTLCHLPAH